MTTPLKMFQPNKFYVNVSHAPGSSYLTDAEGHSVGLVQNEVASLLAAAPDLLAALKACLDEMADTYDGRTPLNDFDTAWERGEAAILKAEGGPS